MIQLKYEISLESPTQIGTGIGQAGFLDNTFYRDSFGRPVIPGSTIKGKAKSIFYRFARQLGYSLHELQNNPHQGCLITDNPCIACRVFGSPQVPGRLYFEEAVLHPDAQKLLSRLDQNDLQHNRKPVNSLNYGKHIRTGVSLDRRYRIALPDHLFTNEYFETSIPFIGWIKGDIIGASDDHCELALLISSLLMITHIGGGCSRGTGKCKFKIENVTIDQNEIPLKLKQLLSVLSSKEAFEK